MTACLIDPPHTGLSGASHMKVTQGQFSFVPEPGDDEIRMRYAYALQNGWSITVEHTDDPHPRSTCWEIWGTPMVDLKDPAGALYEVNERRKARGERYIKVLAFDSKKGFESIRMSHIVNRPKHKPGFGLARTEGGGRNVTCRAHSCATDKPAGTRY